MGRQRAMVRARSRGSRPSRSPRSSPSRRRRAEGGGMTVLYDLFIAPFADFGFMQRALFGSLMLSLGACPVGVFLMLRRMSLAGDAMSHAILPGAAAGFLLYGL